MNPREQTRGQQQRSEQSAYEWRVAREVRRQRGHESIENAGQKILSVKNFLGERLESASLAQSSCPRFEYYPETYEVMNPSVYVSGLIPSGGVFRVFRKHHRYLRYSYYLTVKRKSPGGGYRGSLG